MERQRFRDEATEGYPAKQVKCFTNPHEDPSSHYIPSFVSDPCSAEGHVLYVTGKLANRDHVAKNAKLGRACDQERRGGSPAESCQATAWSEQIRPLS